MLQLTYRLTLLAAFGIALAVLPGISFG